MAQLSRLGIPTADTPIFTAAQDVLIIRREASTQRFFRVRYGRGGVRFGGRRSFPLKRMEQLPIEPVEKEENSFLGGHEETVPRSVELEGGPIGAAHLLQPCGGGDAGSADQFARQLRQQIRRFAHNLGKRPARIFPRVVQMDPIAILARCRDSEH
eukprot:CAMPEP_0171308610 /NCGR_PEP_ID=MMETSP0816-20121228/18707_1 /TAXON_ID=420281 /ORGANISM="Proboscia inermis, Strain CCAP1064/1" /LENGTH=155 /DNA_ID=CAMNT_0011791585 /DNA_START=694 /DNA_END=1161 /DNA_ORIENTATION=-